MSEAGNSAPARPEKAPTAFRTIGEVADDLDLPTHVLRFWEAKFPQLQPVKRRGGRRYYRPEDVVLLRRIRQCLYHDGYTIRGVRQLLGGDVAASPSLPARGMPAAMPTLFPLAAGPAGSADEPPEAPPKPARRPRRRPPSPERKATLEEIRRDLLEARALLDQMLHRPGAP